MTTWRGGRATLIARARARRAAARHLPHDAASPTGRRACPGTAVFMTGNVDTVPTALLHNLKHNKVLHERVVLMTVQTDGHPARAATSNARDPPSRPEFPHRHAALRLHGRAQYPARLGAVPRHAVPLQPDGDLVLRRPREDRVQPAHRRSRAGASELFIFMSNTMLDATEFFRIPTNRVIELGGQIEI